MKTFTGGTHDVTLFLGIGGYFSLGLSAFSTFIYNGYASVLVIPKANDELF